MTDSRLLWTPDSDFQKNSHLFDFKLRMEQKYKISFADYHNFWEWSVSDIARFWENIWSYFDVIDHESYETVLSSDQMPGAQWFKGSKVNYVEHIFRNRPAETVAIYHTDERGHVGAISWAALEAKVAACSHYLKSLGLKAGDRVVAYVPNIPEASITFLACASLGIVWSSCSPDFGIDSVVSRFEQIQPTVLLAADGYGYGGKVFSRVEEVQQIHKRIGSIQKVIWVPFMDLDLPKEDDTHAYWRSVVQNIPSEGLEYEPLPFDHPIFILFSSGTTGVPKAITHGHGGMLLEHLKYLHFHNDVKAGEVFFWYSTTGWMMWNFTHAALLTGASIVLYDGSPGYPNMELLWKLAADLKIAHFGTSAPYLVACMKKGIKPAESYDLSNLRSIGSTGSPLPPEGFDYVYEHIGRHIWLCSMSGGTDVCTAFVGGNPLLPVYEGEIQCRALGCALYCLDDAGNTLENEEGEMIITKPMPCMPIYFWNDEDGSRYKASYFEDFPGMWRHGDWIKLTPRKGLIIYGRSDATLNRQGVRIGTAEIYSVLNQIPEIEDGLIVNLELSGGRHFMPLFVQCKEQVPLSDELKKTIATALKKQYSPRHVPDEIVQVDEIPYTISGKKMEAPVKKILLGKDNPTTFNKDAMRNPHSMDFFRNYAAQIKK